MKVQIVSETVQRFNGETFYLCGAYYQHKGTRLHRAVWEYHNGGIPHGYHVHHIDGDKSNNCISNLALVEGCQHLSYHMSQPDRAQKSREDIQKAINAAREWHGSADGQKWHSEHAKEYWENAPLQTYTCGFCGKEYQTKAVRHKGNHFCCNNCKASYRRRRTRNEG